MVKTNWALRLPLITVATNNTPIEGTPFTPPQYAFGACVNLPGQVFMDKAHEEMVNYPKADMRLFWNVMSNIGKKSRNYNNSGVYYELKLLICEKVWLKRANKKKLSTLYHGPYTVLDKSELSMLILKNNRIEKVSLRNVKAFIPRKDSCDTNNEKNRPYNRER